jgi:signal transduction histidine kinase
VVDSDGDGDGDGDGVGAGAARRLAADRQRIVEKYELGLIRMGSILVAEPATRRQCLEQANNVITDVCAGLRGVSDLFNTRGPSVNLDLAIDIGSRRAAGGIHPVESLRAGSLLFDVVLSGVQEAVADDPAAPLLAAVASQVLHYSLMDRIRTAASSYSSFLLNRTAEAHVGERQRIAREMHDRLGSGVSAAAQAIEMVQIHLRDDVDGAERRLAQVNETLRETLESIRQIAQDPYLHTKTEGLERDRVPDSGSIEQSEG